MVVSLGRNRKSWFVQYAAGLGSKTIFIGSHHTKGAAQEIRKHIRNLISIRDSRSSQTIPEATAKWLDTIQEPLYRKLVAHELVEPRIAKGGGPITIQAFLDSFIETFSGTRKESTVTTWNQARRLLLEYVDGGTPLREFNTGRAIEFLEWLRKRKPSRTTDSTTMSDATIRRRCSCLSQMFAQAVELEYIPKNPFGTKQIPKSDVSGGQKHFVSEADALKVIEELPGTEWKLWFALLRWGGLRNPSEPARLTWADIDWNRMVFTVRSPKTEHHKGKDSREVPIFPEIAALLRQAFEDAEDGAERVLPFLRGKSSAFCRRPLLAAMERAGVQPWPVLFNALRATRATELRMQSHPDHVINAWMGHSREIAESHYLQVTQEHIDRATRQQPERQATCEN